MLVNVQDLFPGCGARPVPRLGGPPRGTAASRAQALHQQQHIQY